MTEFWAGFGIFSIIVITLVNLFILGLTIKAAKTADELNGEMLALVTQFRKSMGTNVSQIGSGKPTDVG